MFYNYRCLFIKSRWVGMENVDLYILTGRRLHQISCRVVVDGEYADRHRDRIRSTSKTTDQLPNWHTVMAKMGDPTFAVFPILSLPYPLSPCSSTLPYPSPSPPTCIPRRTLAPPSTHSRYRHSLAFVRISFHQDWEYHHWPLPAGVWYPWWWWMVVGYGGRKKSSSSWRSEIRFLSLCSASRDRWWWRRSQDYEH